MDITELIWGAELTHKKAKIPEDFIWGIGLEALYQITRAAECKTEPDKIAVKRPYPTIQ